MSKRKNGKSGKSLASREGLAVLMAGLMVLSIIIYGGVTTWKQNYASLDEIIGEARASLTEGRQPWSEIFNAASESGIETLVVDGSRVIARMRDGRTVEANAIGKDALDQLISQAIRHRAEVLTRPSTSSSLDKIGALINGFVMLLVVAVLLIVLRTTHGGGKSFSPVDPKINGIRFSDVAGIDSVASEIAEVVNHLKNPKALADMNGRPPRGILLVSPPGNGKTLLAKAVAGEAGVPFFAVTGSQFDEMFVGVGMGRVKGLFRAARKAAPCVIFIDEIDSLASKRSAGPGARKFDDQTLNQLLVELDGFDPRDGIVLIAATNRPDMLDPAILRPGRIDRRAYPGNPDLSGRTKILEVHARNKPIAPDVDLADIARQTTGMSGADLANVVDEAVRCACSAGRSAVTMSDFRSALDRIMLGLLSGKVMQPEERRSVAEHEAGHLVTAALMPGADRPVKATIAPRGEALGLVASIPDDRFNIDRQRLRARLVVLMGGRAAEELYRGSDGHSAGAAGDIEHATSIAASMVCRFGMSSLGIAARPAPGEAGFDAATTGQAINEILQDALERAQFILNENKALLDAFVTRLLDEETLECDVIEHVVAQHRIRQLAG